MTDEFISIKAHKDDNKPVKYIPGDKQDTQSHTLI